MSGPKRVYSNYCAIAFMKLAPLGVPTPVTLSQPGPVVSDVSVPNVITNQRVENGLLKVAYDKYDTLDGQFGHLFYKDKFSYYLVAVEYRFVGEQAKGAPSWALRNNGIMVHSQPPETMGFDQDFPTSIEVQLLGGDGVHERPNGNVCTPGTNIVMDGQLYTPHCYQLKAKTYHGDGWVRVVAEVLGSEKITHYVEGVPVISYTKPQLGGDARPGAPPCPPKSAPLSAR